MWVQRNPFFYGCRKGSVSEDRRTVLADAAIEVLAELGMRGLTHRAVDRAAAMPPGTTSAYFRTRAALLTALVRRLVARDQAELQAAGERAVQPRTPAEMTDALAGLTDARLAPGEGRMRSLARYACALESVRDAELREILLPRENAGREVVRTFLAAHGVPDPESRTLALLASVDGLVLDQLPKGGEVSRDALEGLVAAALR